MKRLNDEMKQVLEEFDKFHNKPIETLSPQEARQQSELKDAVLATINNHPTKRIMGVMESVARVDHIEIYGRGEDNNIILRIYRPDMDTNLKPAVLYFHGGGMVIANLNTYDSSCRALCNAAKCVVISVAYRQAPEHKFPAAPQDALLAYEWVVGHCMSLGIDSKKIAVVGESAGGNLAAGLCIQAKKRGLVQPVHQVLIYPMLDARFDTESYKENAFAKPLNLSMMKWFWEHYLETDADKEDELACPIKAKTLVGLPAATIILAEIDPLRSEGKAYGEKLAKDGVLVKTKIYKGVAHEFFGMGAVVSEGKEAVKFVADQLIHAFDKSINKPEDQLPINFFINPYSI